MKQNTNKLENFQVIRDGEPDQDYYSHIKHQDRVQAARSIGHGTLQLLSAITHPMVSTVAEMATNLELDIYDAQHGTHIRQEYLNQKREAAAQAIAERFGLL